MGGPIYEFNRRGFTILYRWLQLRFRNDTYMTDKSVPFEEIWERLKTSKSYEMLVEAYGQEEAERSIFIGALIVYLFAFYGPGQSERAWNQFYKVLTPEDKRGAE